MTAPPIVPPRLANEDRWKGLDACVHCGFCLQACPTYIALGDENDSPRGRIVLMRALAEGELAATDADLEKHIGQCLGCRGCETVCPSGVPYGELLEATRATLSKVRPVPPLTKLILWVFSRPRWMAFAFWVVRVFRALRLPGLVAWIPGVPGFAAAMLASTTRPRFLNERPYRHRPGSGQRSLSLRHGLHDSGWDASSGASVAMLEGCVMRGLFSETNLATERVLEANGYTRTAAPGQGCCGALHLHAGDIDGARWLAQANVEAFMAVNPSAIAVNAAGCGAMLRSYGTLLADDPRFAPRAATFASRVRDITELLAEAGPQPGAPIRALAGVAVTYDPPCHLLHAQHVATPPLEVLRAIPELRLVPLADADQCCGGAGIFNLVHPELSHSVLAAKLARIAESEAEVVATGNPGCAMQIGAGLWRAGLRARAVHPVDLLDASYAADP